MDVFPMRVYTCTLRKKSSPLLEATSLIVIGDINPLGVIVDMFLNGTRRAVMYRSLSLSLSLSIVYARTFNTKI